MTRQDGFLRAGSAPTCAEMQSRVRCQACRPNTVRVVCPVALGGKRTTHVMNDSLSLSCFLSLPLSLSLSLSFSPFLSFSLLAHNMRRIN